MKRSNDDLKTEVEFLKNHLKINFQKTLSLEEFSEQLNKILTERINDYIYQRYRDWESLELLKLLIEFKTEVEKPVEKKVEKPVEKAPEKLITSLKSDSLENKPDDKSRKKLK